MNTFLQTPTNNLRHSLDFYKKLNFKILSSESPALVTDGKAIIEINPDRFARAGIKFYKNNWSTKIELLKKLTKVSNMNSILWMCLIYKQFCHSAGRRDSQHAPLTKTLQTRPRFKSSKKQQQPQQHQPHRTRSVP